MDELFPVESVSMDSPRLAWMKGHGIITLNHKPGHVAPTWFAGFQRWWPTLAGVDFFAAETGAYGGSRVSEGDTEDEALAGLATTFGIPLWNEEQAHG